ncbi:MAG: UDP-N-acetylmuramate dehydrogenase [Anaerolineaceae bacterium]|nr:UDP-N-acetylmuramate dehydrogenase [Anaerolineaceae bacterium]
MKSSASTVPMKALRNVFGTNLQENVMLANYTTARVGGAAEALLIVHSAKELAETIRNLWNLQAPYRVLGSGSNVLISDRGLQEVIVINRANLIKVGANTNPPTVWAESGASMASIGKRLALRGLAGFAWGTYIPGTLGGAVYGNAGAHGGDIQSQLILADILHPELGKVQWTSEQFDYGYRSSILKREDSKAVILSVRLELSQSTRDEMETCLQTIYKRRVKMQPPGSSLGSIFKNPKGDKAGRLIEAAGLKGSRIGDVEISQIHANFFVNHGNANARDIYSLIHLAQQTVNEKFGVQLEMEIELLGDWTENDE